MIIHVELPRLSNDTPSEHIRTIAKGALSNMAMTLRQSHIINGLKREIEELEQYKREAQLKLNGLELQVLNLTGIIKAHQLIL